ncbi:GLPGLI family protein [Chryseobacterium hagamense]|nr:GLPGLI family protein [Chryseobacterium hagamense]
MNFTNKQILRIIFLFYFSISFSQIAKSDSLRGEFIYLLKYKPNTLNENYIRKELFSLQIGDNRAFFISENKLKIDSVFSSAYNNKAENFVLDFTNIPTGSNFLIIQTNEHSQFYETVGMSLLSYNSYIIDNWKLIDENKVINSITCKKAEVHYKGRDWTAWYATEIPFPYGPYKFSGLPGLIVKITDKTGDYDFELVKSISSSNVKGKMITINKRHYQNAKLVTKKELVEARKNFRENSKHQLESMGTVFSQDPKDNFRERQKVNEAQKKGHNPIELED